jgi:hypothetical protein
MAEEAETANTSARTLGVEEQTHPINRVSQLDLRHRIAAD